MKKNQQKEKKSTRQEKKNSKRGSSWIRAIEKYCGKKDIKLQMNQVDSGLFEIIGGRLQ